MSMKLGRSKPLRRTALRRSRADSYSRRIKDVDPAREAWKRPRYGRCQNCGLIDDRPLHGHHVLARQKLAQMGLPEFDPRNRMDLCDKCHMNHEFGQANRKIKIERVPVHALEFVLEALGEGGSAAYLARHYDCSVTR
jgi:hypothetical protein